jgi:hypothetical protein
MSENKRLLARYDKSIQNYARLLAAAATERDTSSVGYDLIEASVTVEQRRDTLLPFAEGWMLEFIAVATNFIRAMVKFTNDRSGNPSVAENVRSSHTAYETIRSRYFSSEDLAEA